MPTDQTYERMRKLVDDAAALSFVKRPPIHAASGRVMKLEEIASRDVLQYDHSGCCVATVSPDEYSRVLRRCAEGTGPNEALKQLFARHGRGTHA